MLVPSLIRFPFASYVRAGAPKVAISLSALNVLPLTAAAPVLLGRQPRIWSIIAGIQCPIMVLMKDTPKPAIK
jgi:hypothetical protein